MTRHWLHFWGACVLSGGMTWPVFAEDDAALLAAPPPADSVNQRPAELQGEGQGRAVAQALYAHALLKEMESGFESALPEYLAVIKADPHFVELQVKVAFYYLEQHQVGKSLDLLSKTVQDNPQSGQAQAAFAFVEQADGHMDVAVNYARTALTLEPDSVMAHRVLFESLRDLDRMTEAMALARSVPSITCQDPKIWGQLAREYTEMICAATNISREELAKIISPIYDKAFAVGTPSSDLLVQRGDFEYFLGHKEDALKYFKQATEEGEPSAELLVRVGNLEAQMNQVPEAIKSYEAAYQLDANFQMLREQLAYEYVLNNQEDKAINLLNEIVKQNPAKVGIYADLGRLYQKAGKLDKAEQNFRWAVELDSSNPEGYLLLGQLLLSQKRVKEAENFMNTARDHFPSNARIAFCAAVVEREIKNYSQALDLFAQTKILADERDSDFPYASYYYELSLAQEQAGKPLQSEMSLKEGLNRDPNNEDLLNALAYLWAEQGKNLSEALRYSKRSLQISPDKPEFLDTLGWVYFKMAKYQDALPFIERASELVDNEPEVLDHLAQTYDKLGQTKEALATLDKILSKDPDNAQIRQEYDRIKKSASVAQTQSSSVSD